LNLAACQLRTKDFDKVILNCSKALDIDTKSVKALFRRGQAYSRMSEFDKAKSDFVEALQYESNNKDIKNEYEHLKKKVAAYNQEKKKMFGGIFDRMKKEEEVEEEKKE
jgi:FK506-binding protein 4/5